MQAYVYIIANQSRGTLYVGMATDLQRRIWEHKEKFVSGFSSEYNLDKLVWFEIHERIESAVTRERSIKKWLRVWKIEMIEKMNPTWKDLYEEL